MKKYVPLILLIIATLAFLIFSMMSQPHWYPKPKLVPEPSSMRWHQKTVKILDCISLNSYQNLTYFFDEIKPMYSELFFAKHKNLTFGDK